MLSSNVLGKPVNSIHKLSVSTVFVCPVFHNLTQTCCKAIQLVKMQQHQNSQPGQRRDNYKGFNKNQNKYIPKATAQSDSNKPKPDPGGAQNYDESGSRLLTSSLRQNSDRKPMNYKNRGDGKASSGNNCIQVWRGSSGNEEKMSSDKCKFVKYLPQDDAIAAGLGAEDGGLDPEETQGVADLLNQELRALLRMRPREFWRTVATDVSLHEFLDSYLQFRKRWYDLPHRSRNGSMAGVVVGDQELSQRVFMVLYRMSSNQDLGVCANESFSSKEHTDLLLGKRLLDIPKLMDVCAIYGHDNAKLTQSLVLNALKSQPGLIDESKEVVPQFLHIVETMHHRCCSALEAPPSSGNNLTSRVGRLHEDLLEVMDFINDAVATLDAFLEAYSVAALRFISRGVSNEDNQELLPALANIYDSLLPLLQKGFTLIMENAIKSASDDMELLVQPRLNTLGARIVKFAWQLLYICYLSQNFGQDDYQFPSTKIFPAQVEDPVVRGDIIIQVLGEIAAGSSGGVDGPISSGSFLSNLERRHKLMSKLDELSKDGWIHLDEAQYDHISLLVGHFKSKTENGAGKRVLSSSTLSLKDEIATDEQTAILQSKISQIKEIFPDYGDGFLSSCLDVYNDNPEEVIQRILEGTLHPDLLHLNTSLQSKPNNKQSVSKNDKGKGRLDESAYLTQDKYKLNGSTSHMQNRTASSSSSAGELQKPSLVPDMKSNASGRYVRRQKDDVNAASILDQQDVKNTFRSAILATQYEDEYDDSFDDLGTGVVDSGIAETESLNNRLHPQSASRWTVETALDDVGSPKKVHDSLDNRALRENLAKVPQRKQVSEGSLPDVKVPAPTFQRTGNSSYGRGKRKEEQKPQFYVKDGKNYSYKVAGAVAVSSAEEAEVLKKIESETIYGLGAGGNVPWKALESSDDTPSENNNNNNVNIAGRGGSIRGRGGNGRGGNGRGGGRGDNHRRKDQAMKKHFNSIGGY